MMRREDLERTDEWMAAHAYHRKQHGPQPEVAHYRKIGAAIAFVPIMLFAVLSGIREPGLPAMIVTAAEAGTGYLHWREKAASRYRVTCQMCESPITERRKSEAKSPK